MIVKLINIIRNYFPTRADDEPTNQITEQEITERNFPTPRFERSQDGGPQTSETFIIGTIFEINEQLE